MATFAATGALTLALSAAPAAAQDCDEPCLRAAADGFLEALAANDPSRLDYNAYARYTENGMELDFGDALWTTTSSVPDRYRIYVLDAEAGQIGLVATLQELGRPSIMAARIKVERGRISEVETVVSRQAASAPAEYDDLDTPDPLFGALVPAEARRTRDELIAIADSYFEAVEDDDGGIAPFSDRCVRVENGAMTAGRDNRPRPPASGWKPSGTMGATGCAEQLSLGVHDYISSIEPRRHEVVDAGRGLVFGIYRFNHDGVKTQLTLSDGSVADAPPHAITPGSTLIAELFKIDESGEILRVEAVGTGVHYRAPTGWRGQ